MLKMVPFYRPSPRRAMSPREATSTRPKPLAVDAFAKLDAVTDMCKSALSPPRNPRNHVYDKNAPSVHTSALSSVTVRESPQVLKSEVKFLNYNNINNNNNANNKFNMNIDRKRLIEIQSVPESPPKDFGSPRKDFDLHIRKDSLSPGKDFVCPRKGGDNSYTDYFDNLIALIDEAAKELSI